MAVGEAARKSWWERGHLAYLLWEIQGGQPAPPLCEFVHLLATDKEWSLGPGFVVSGPEVMGREGPVEELEKPLWGAAEGPSWSELE